MQLSVPPKRLLIVLHGAIGDVCRALPLAVRIKRNWPGTKLVWAVEPTALPLVVNHSAVDSVVVFDRPRGFKAYRAFIKALRNEHCEVALDLQRHFKSGLTTKLSGARMRIGFHRRNAKEGNWLFSTHTIKPVENFSSKIYHYQLFGDFLGLPPEEKLEFGIEPSAEEQKAVAVLMQQQAEFSTSEDHGPERRIAIVVGSTWLSRFWPVGHVRELVRILSEQCQFTPVLVGGPSEVSFAENVLSEEDGRLAINLVGKTKLSQLPALFRAVRVVVAADSGPMHIAAAMRVPVVSLWGATSPARSAPYNSETLVLQSPLGCSPCYKRACPGLGTLCMESIRPEVVLAQLSRVM